MSGVGDQPELIGHPPASAEGGAAARSELRRGLAEEPFQAELQARISRPERRRGGGERDQERGEQTHLATLHGD